MSISAAMVKELRERTGSGMMECKKALVETNGDIEAAIELMRKSGLAKADKKADRTAAEGRIEVALSDDKKTAAIVEVNSETDFVGNGDELAAFAKTVAEAALKAQPASLEELLAAPFGTSGKDVNTVRQELIAKIGENIQVRRFELVKTSGNLGVYRHGNRIGVVVNMNGGSEDVAKDVAMHVAAAKPQCVNESEVSAETLAKEKEIFAAQAAESGKPADIIEKMVQGRISKFLKEVTLLGQPFIKDPDVTVEKLLKQHDAIVNSFIRLEVGEGIEKEVTDFAAEVMAQVKGS